jgi:hypothetical protein
MRQEEPRSGGSLGPLAALPKILPFAAAAASDRLGWVGLEAARYRAAPASEINSPPFILSAARNETSWRYCESPGDGVTGVPAAGPSLPRARGTEYTNLVCPT